MFPAHPATAVGRGRVKMDVQAPRLLTFPLTPDEEKLKERIISQFGLTRPQAELTLQEMKRGEAALKGTDQQIIAAGEEVDTIGVGGFPLPCEDEKTVPVRVKNSKGIEAWTKWGNIEPLA